MSENIYSCTYSLRSNRGFFEATLLLPLDGTLRQTFESWYLGMEIDDTEQTKVVLMAA